MILSVLGEIELHVKVSPLILQFRISKKVAARCIVIFLLSSFYGAKPEFLKIVCKIRNIEIEFNDRSV